MKNRFLITLIVFVHSHAFLQTDCQNNAYTLSTFIEEYEEIDTNSEIQLEFPEDATSIYDFIFEEQVPIGFNFQYFNTQISHLSVLFGNEPYFEITCQTSEAPQYENLRSILISNFQHCNWAFSQEESAAYVSYISEGEIGNRIFKLQYKDVGLFFDSVYPEQEFLNSFNFQLWFYESDNSIEFRYGPQVFNSNIDAIFDQNAGGNWSIGLVCNLDTQDELVPYFASHVVGEIENPELLDVDQNLAEVGFDLGDIEFLNSIPEPNRVYRFENQIVSINDIGDDSDELRFSNPIDEFLSIQSSDRIETLKLIDLSGRVVLENLDVNANYVLVGTQSLKLGLYSLILKTSKSEYRRKVIKSS